MYFAQNGIYQYFYSRSSASGITRSFYKEVFQLITRDSIISVSYTHLTLLTRTRIQDLFAEQFGFSTIDVEDGLYEVATAPKTFTKRNLFPDDKVVFYTTSASGAAGAGLWGVTPEDVYKRQIFGRTQRHWWPGV